MTGLLEKDLLGKPLKELLSVPTGNNVPEPDELTQRVMNGNEIHDQRYAVLTARGEAIPVLLNTLPLKDPGNERVGLMGIVRDLKELEGLKRALEDRYSFANIIGTGPHMQEIFELIERVSDTGTNVLIQGESGTGKELVARAFHYHSPRKDHAFIKINCAALPDPLLESELFGYEKGAFTGAYKRKPGKFKLAHGGTIFLDEIGETSPAFQAKLLRVVQDLEFEPLGGTTVERVDVRILAATNKDLRKEIASGRFREDLYYRLCVLPVVLPPLRDRKEDIPLLIDHFLEKVAGKYHNRKIEKPVFTPWAVSVLMDHAWPGNIRELENAVERAYVCSTTGRIEVSSLPPEIRDKMAGVPLKETDPSHPPNAQPHGQETDDGSVDLIWKVLSECDGNKTLAAKKLGIGRTTLWRRLQENKSQAETPS
jgi:PAS domain S-box-containing protein